MPAPAAVRRASPDEIADWDARIASNPDGGHMVQSNRFVSANADDCTMCPPSGFDAIRASQSAISSGDARRTAAGAGMEPLGRTGYPSLLGPATGPYGEPGAVGAVGAVVGSPRRSRTSSVPPTIAAGVATTASPGTSSSR